jgi:hypothetical protein
LAAVDTAAGANDSTTKSLGLFSSSVNLAALTSTSAGVLSTLGAFGASTLYGAASGCTAGAKALGLGDLNQSKTAFNIKFSYEVFTIATKNWFKN